MGKANEKLVLEFDTNTGKCSINGGVPVYFKGFATEQEFNKIVEQQKVKDRADPPPDEPTDRDGYLVCKFAPGASIKTWHTCSTVPPYNCTNSGSQCFV